MILKKLWHFKASFSGVYKVIAREMNKEDESGSGSDEEEEEETAPQGRLPSVGVAT